MDVAMQTSQSNTSSGETLTAFEHNDTKPWKVVKLPDLFLSFLATAPRINPHLEEAKAATKAWTTEHCQPFDSNIVKKVEKIQSWYFCSIIAPDCGPNELTLFCNWINWVFVFDDRYDEGDLKMSAAMVRAEVDQLLEPLRSDLEKLPASRVANNPAMVHDSIWFPLREVGLIRTAAMASD